MWGECVWLSSSGEPSDSHSAILWTVDLPVPRSSSCLAIGRNLYCIIAEKGRWLYSVESCCPCQAPQWQWWEYPGRLDSDSEVSGCWQCNWWHLTACALWEWRSLREWCWSIGERRMSCEIKDAARLGENVQKCRGGHKSNLQYSLSCRGKINKVSYLCCSKLLPPGVIWGKAREYSKRLPSP